MSVIKLLEEWLEKLPDGSVFTLDEVSHLGTRSSLAMALSRLVKKEILTRIKNGLYLKPKTGKFGVLPPTREAIVRAVTKNGKTGYISGVSAYNRLGFTTQVPNTLTIKGGVSRGSFSIKGVSLKKSPGKEPIRKKDIPLMVLLDSIRQIKDIPDSKVEDVIQQIKKNISKLSKLEKIRLIDLALESKPVVRAVVGAIIEETNPELIERLLKSLNPLTKFKLRINNLKFQKKWKIE